MSAITLLDGSIGQELVHRSGKEPTPLWSTSVMLEQPDLVRQVHDAYFAAGASVATTNTYAVHENRLEWEGLQDRQGELIRVACAEAAAARDACGKGRIAGALGPVLATYRPDLDPDPDTAAPRFRAMAQMMGDVPDLYLVETVSSLREAEGALRGLKGLGKPVWIAFTVKDDDGSRLRSGEPVEGVLTLVERFDVAAVLINCSPPEAIPPALDILKRQPRPFGAYANGFTRIGETFLEAAPTVSALEARKDLTPEAYATLALQWVEQGATIVGGCCEVGPDHIARLAAALAEKGHVIQ